MKFTAEELRDIVWDDHPAAEVIEDNVTDNSRWSIHHTCIFKYGGVYYRTHYSVGATESQDEQPYEYDGDEIEVEVVEQREVKVLKWVKVDENKTIWDNIELSPPEADLDSADQRHGPGGRTNY